MNPPTLSDTEARAQSTFTALMWSLAHPGEPQILEARPGDVSGLETIAEALLDLETSFYTSSSALEEPIKRTGANATSSNEAAYHFHLEITPGVLFQLEYARVGTPLYPDESASLILACSQDSGVQLRLTGPGIPSEQIAGRVIRALGVPLEFWTLRQRKMNFPLGWDVFLVSRVAAGIQIIGIPRSTRVEVL
jgi:alpha-D-ribose 1-methylphosphonate 5-triphosphate synthase subunit PhnH